MGRKRPVSPRRSSLPTTLRSALLTLQIIFHLAPATFLVFTLIVCGLTSFPLNFTFFLKSKHRFLRLLQVISFLSPPTFSIPNFRINLILWSTYSIDDVHLYSSDFSIICEGLNSHSITKCSSAAYILKTTDNQVRFFDNLNQ